MLPEYKFGEPFPADLWGKAPFRPTAIEILLDKGFDLDTAIDAVDALRASSLLKGENW
ncbi:hypothetical protein [Actinopolyspora erythraea]|uniref:hypothetical protein n=1 Tax=Actinopolyspora erythraea TaxID=414996 RepID=UPI0018DFD0DA|nr:hypothetical protein [Actinopolyspora erythraea]